MMVHSITEFFELFLLSLKVKLFLACESLKAIGRYYPRLHFARTDLYFRLSYAFFNPFRISKSFLRQRGDADLYTYGETPLTTLEQIAKQAALSSADVVFELGCGRGLGCFWLREFIDCAVVGIEQVPLFVKKAKMIQKKMKINRLEFRAEDFFQTDFTGATAIYLYGTSLAPACIKKLIQTFSLLPSGVKIITVSYSLSDFGTDLPFDLLRQFSAVFPWGEADVFVQRKR